MLSFGLYASYAHPKWPSDSEEFPYDGPGSDIWAWRNRYKSKQKKKPMIDGSGAYIPYDLLEGAGVNWEAKLSIHDPGVVDPLPKP
jgi:hypothetical protein